MKPVAILPSDLGDRSSNPDVPVLGAGELAELDPRLFVEPIVWGWKRDAESPRLSRLVYFGARHVASPAGTRLVNPFFFYAHWGSPRDLAPVIDRLPPRTGDGLLAETTSIEVLKPAPATTLLRIISGRPAREDLERLGKLASRQPDHPLPTPPRVPSQDIFDLRRHRITRFDLLAGSGLSYESGLPMLKEVHDLFWVDDGDAGFCLGARDQLPRLLLGDMEGTFRGFAGWHIQAARARPSQAHECLSRLRDAGLLGRVFTDNIDRLFAAAGIPDYVPVRGSGVVNEIFPAEFDPDSDGLLVVGVSADRRGIIGQARRRGLKLVVINPYVPVSPGARNLDYLRDGDVYFRLTASEALPRIVADTRPERRFRRPLAS